MLYPVRTFMTLVNQVSTADKEYLYNENWGEYKYTLLSLEVDKTNVKVFTAHLDYGVVN